MEIDKCSANDAAQADAPNILLNLELPTNDLWFKKKKKLLEDIGFNPSGPVCLQSFATADQLKTALTVILQRARIINLDELELYFGGDNLNNLVGFNSSRNELEALRLVLAAIDEAIPSSEHATAVALLDLRQATVDLLCEFSIKIREDTRICAEKRIEKENSLLQWGESNEPNPTPWLSYTHPRLSPHSPYLP
ncbi:unnamed protein product [Cuscuta campestris]|uniref:Rubisco LSMT substrate-binding domain-containing protein n=1 Tax=Cuscuta campestris TaxID=132261 RepID=A0A484KE11_9ASTE|nr:unnamed protein product [Cuscuta campestris]